MRKFPIATKQYIIEDVKGNTKSATRYKIKNWFSSDENLYFMNKGSIEYVSVGIMDKKNR